MTPSLEQQAQRAADEFRREHRLGVQPLGDLVALIEQTTGHDVAILDADPDEHGLIMRDPERNKVFIGVARSHKPMRQRSSLAHELAHLIFQDWSDELGKRSPEEIRADAFARHLLVPQEGVKEFLGSTHDVSRQTLSDVVQRFLVSPAIAAIAMREAGYVPSGLASEWGRTPRRSWQRGSGGAINMRRFRSTRIGSVHLRVSCRERSRATPRVSLARKRSPRCEESRLSGLCMNLRGSE